MSNWLSAMPTEATQLYILPIAKPEVCAGAELRSVEVDQRIASDAMVVYPRIYPERCGPIARVLP